jgi:hypothetical protein
MAKCDADLSAAAWPNVTKGAQKNNTWEFECTAGTTRVVDHLLGTGKGVKACNQCPAGVKQHLASLGALKDADKNAKLKRKRAFVQLLVANRRSAATAL